MNASQKYSVVGKGIPVIDGGEKVTGAFTFGVDKSVQGMVYGKILRSPHAHARIRHINTSKAEALSGVVGVVTHEDAPGLVWEGAWFNYRGKILDDTVRFAGDEVAAVAAVTQEIAEEAVKLIEVDYEVLPAVFDPDEALKPGAPQIRDEGNARPPYVLDWGDVKKGEEEADEIVEAEFRFTSQQMAPIGRNACIAEWHGDRVTVWTSTQTPSELRDGIHEALGIPLSKVRVLALPSGSSFGQWWSANFMMLTALLARKVGKPVKIELSNEECMATVKRRHMEVTRGRMGCKRDGTLTFVQFDHVFDNGAYGYKVDVGFRCVDTWGKVENGHYGIQGVNTNLVTAGCMRAVGDVTLGSAVERIADMLAARVDMDPVEFRLKNQIRAGEAIRKTHSKHDMKGNMEVYLKGVPEEHRGQWPKLFHLSSGSTEDILVRGSKEFGWKKRWKGWGVPSGVAGPKRRGVGVGTGTHGCGVETEGSTSAVVRINPDGSAKLFCSAGRQGQGSETTQLQLASETLGIPMDDIEIEMGDTDSCPWSHGSLASNTIYRIGFANRAACLDARRQLLEIAAREFFHTDPDDLDIENGMIRVKNGSQGREIAVSIGEVLNEFRSDTMGQTSSITGRPTIPMPPATTFARHFAAHFVEVEVDTETGEIRLLDYLAAQDSGTVINPQVLKNQVVGGAICSAGFTLCEGLAFDEKTGKVINADLLDYKLLRSVDFPANTRVIFSESYDPVGPFGARGAGEAPAAAPVPAIAQAVYNATGAWVEPPMTPERVLRALGKI